MDRQRYRLQFKPGRRLIRTIVLGLCLATFAPGLLATNTTLGLRVFCAAAVASSLWSLRFLWGAMLEVRPEGIRILKWWPRRRDIPWYRIDQVEVVPGLWYLALDLNSGERIELPCVERLDDLFAAVELGRTDLDRISS